MSSSVGEEQVITIANEFGGVILRKVRTSTGERLEISAPRLGYETRLDAVQLEAIAWQTPEFFSTLMETPFGPGHEIA